MRQFLAESSRSEMESGALSLISMVWFRSSIFHVTGVTHTSSTSRHLALTHCHEFFETSSSSSWLNTDRNKKEADEVSVPLFSSSESKYRRQTEMWIAQRATRPPPDRRLLSLWNRTGGRGTRRHEQNKNLINSLSTVHVHLGIWPILFSLFACLPSHL